MWPPPPPLLLLLLSALCAAADDHTAADAASTHANPDYVLHQKAVLKIFQKIQQGLPLLFTEYDNVTEFTEDYKWESMKEKFQDPALLERFMYWYHHGVFLKRNTDFSMTYTPHLWQVEQVYKLLYSATDFDTFWKMAMWMRCNLNVRMLAHALFSALLHRNDTQLLTVPPPYEVFPQYFVTGDVMQRAYVAHLTGFGGEVNSPVSISASHTGRKDARDEESALSYFREDVALASYWAFFEYQHPPWLNTSDSHHLLDHGAPALYVLMRNLLARYDMERYSQRLPPVTQADLWEPVEGYDPQITYQSGQQFPGRPEGLKAKSTDVLSLEDLMDWEGRIRAGVAMSIYLDDQVQVKQLNEENAMRTIARALRGGEDSPNRKYYGSIYNGLFTIFGRVMDPYHKYGMSPSVLEVPDTMTRDPLFYRILKRMWRVMDGYKNILAPYRKEDLVVPGVKIESMKIDKLTTFLDDFTFHIDNAIPVLRMKDANKTNVIARQPRLNHKPFSYLLKVSSDKERTAMVRLFLGPADGSGRLWTGDDVRHHFYLLDTFDVQLKSGENSLERSSRDFFNVGHDPPGLRQLLDQVESSQQEPQPASAGQRSLTLEGFPHHLLLPQGRRHGLPVTLVAVVTDSQGRRWQGHTFTDRRDPFFPMDRSLFMWELETVPNVHVEHVNIFHRSKDELNITD